MKDATVVTKKASARKRRKLLRFVYHLLQHTAICVPFNGGKPSEPTKKCPFSLMLGSDVQFTVLLPGSHRPRLALNFPGTSFACTGKPTVFVKAFIAN